MSASFAAVLVLLGISLALAGLCLPLVGPDEVTKRLQSIGAGRRPRSLEELELEQPFSERVLKPLMRWLSAPIARLAERRQQFKQREGLLVAVQKRLMLAGSPNDWTPAEWIGLKVVVATGLAVVAVLVSVAWGRTSLAIPVAMFAAAIGLALPELWLTARIKARQQEITRALPDAMDLLVISVEAGLGFDAALARLVAKSDNALTREFARAMTEVRLGRPRREALRDIVSRTEVPDLAQFISAIVQAEQLGVSIAKVLSVQAEQLRIARRQRAEELAHQAPVKMLLPLAVFIFPALCLVLLGPMWPTMANSPGGAGI